jgi:ribosomal protein L22
VTRRVRTRLHPLRPSNPRYLPIARYASAPTKESALTKVAEPESEPVKSSTPAATEKDSKKQAYSDYMKELKQSMNTGGLSNSSIFSAPAPKPTSNSSPQASESTIDVFPSYVSRKSEVMALAMDPYPDLRENWERSQIVQMVRNEWKISKTDHLRRTERQCLIRSLALKSSRKKLGMIARQLTGKTVDEAILQLRFSKKRIAIEVLKSLEHAKNIAVAKWGMGLGKAEGRAGNPVTITLKDGKKREIRDRTEIYISQSFVNKVGIDKEPEFRARGKVNILKKPWMSKYHSE